jgi:hypothetical protein
MCTFFVHFKLRNQCIEIVGEKIISVIIIITGYYIISGVVITGDN